MSAIVLELFRSRACSEGPLSAIFNQCSRLQTAPLGSAMVKARCILLLESSVQSSQTAN